ncbi:MAG: hypothetical protein PHQ17_07555 [Methanobacterium sp.]|jgi:hypothetical protein|nr:hypothetical protein [Methanobacterium sp.]
MASDSLPEILEIEYSLNSRGHNSLKFVDGRFFFFSEADSHLSEKNEYLTLVSIPENDKWKCFWDDLDRLGIWEWEENYKKIEDTSNEDINKEIPGKGDVWQLKIIHGKKRISKKIWSSEPESKDEFFKAVQKLVGVDIRLPFMILFQKLSHDANS